MYSAQQQYSNSCIDLSNSPSTSSSRHNISSCSTENSNLKLPAKYLNRRKGLERQKTVEDLSLIQNNGVMHSNSQTTIQNKEFTPQKAKLLQSQSQVDHHSQQIASTASLNSLDKDKAIDFVKSQLGLNFILIDLNKDRGSMDVLSQAKHELVQDLKQKKKLAFVMGIEESQLNQKINSLVEKRLNQQKAEIRCLRDELESIKSERDQLQVQMQMYLDQTLRFSGNLLSQTFESQLSQSMTEIDLQMSRQSSIASIINSSQQTITSVNTFSSDIPDLDGKIPQLKAIQNYIFANSQPQKMSQEQKEMQMINQNRDALLKRYLIAENKDMNVNESKDEITPQRNPPNACTVILESFIKDNKFLKNQFPKLQFIQKDLRESNNQSINPLSTRIQSIVQEYCLAEQSEMIESQRSSDISQTSDELSMLQEETPLSDFAIDLIKVKHNHKNQFLKQQLQID